MPAAVDRRKKGWAAVALAAALAAMLAMPEPAGAGENEAWNAERAFVEMERLQAEIGVLRALAGAQAALLAWNRERAGSGAGPAVLGPHLCAEDTRAGEGLAPWCRALPATFGADAAVAADGRDGKDGRR
ncbi:MAG: hypothetical protein OXO52_17565 [Rhodospirillales bacterium]|nr:hypothetical protein [Rhodospirillales bacterium]MDE0380017.1 hypothetical protein [Rhodospirillales bacterium]